MAIDKAELATFRKKHWSQVRQKLQDIDFLPQHFNEAYAEFYVGVSVTFTAEKNEDALAQQARSFTRLKDTTVCFQEIKEPAPLSDSRLMSAIHFRMQIYGKARNYHASWKYFPASADNQAVEVIIEDIDRTNPSPVADAFHKRAVQEMTAIDKLLGREKTLRSVAGKHGDLKRTPI